MWCSMDHLLAVPITQYNLLVSRPGKVMLGSSCVRASTESPQLLAKLEHVAPTSAVVEKSHSTARGERAAAIAGTSPMVGRCVR